MLVCLLRYHFEEERLRTESEHCTKSRSLTPVPLGLSLQMSPLARAKLCRTTVT